MREWAKTSVVRGSRTDETAQHTILLKKTRSPARFHRTFGSLALLSPIVPGVPGVVGVVGVVGVPRVVYDLGSGIDVFQC